MSSQSEAAAVLGTYSHPLRVGGGQEVQGRGGAWAAAKPGAGCRLMRWRGRAGTLPEYPCEFLHATAGSLSSQKESHLHEPDLRMGCRSLRGIPGCSPSCHISLGSVGWRRGLEAHPSERLTRGIWRLGSLLWDPKRHCPCIFSRIIWGPFRDLQVRGGLFG